MGYVFDSLMMESLTHEAVRQGKLSWVREVLRKCQDVKLKPYALIGFVRALAKAGEEEVARKEFEVVKKWVMRAKDEGERNTALTNLVEAIAPLDRVEEIEALLEAINDEEERKSALELAIQNCKKPEVAEIFAQRFNNPYAWCLVGRRYVEAGQKEKALSAFRKALQVGGRQWVTIVAKNMIEAGFFDEGVKLLEGQRLDTFTLHHVLDVLARWAERKNFLKLLPQCRWGSELAYQACGWLAKFYPERAKDLAQEILSA